VVGEGGGRSVDPIIFLQESGNKRVFFADIFKTSFLLLYITAFCKFSNNNDYKLLIYSLLLLNLQKAIGNTQKVVGNTQNYKYWYESLLKVVGGITISLQKSVVYRCDSVCMYYCMYISIYVRLLLDRIKTPK
jgi:hypothetical protein